MAIFFGVLAGSALLAVLVLGGRALLLPDAAGSWRAVAAAVSDPLAVCVPATTLASAAAARAPRSRVPCAWATTWVSEARDGVGSGAGAAGVAVFERTRAPVVFESAHGSIVLGADDVLVQPAAGAAPFGVALADRAIERTAAGNDYAAWAAAGDTARRGQVRFGEVVLEAGSEVELVGSGEPLGPAPGLRGVLVLRPGEAAAAAGRAAAELAARAERWRPVAIAAGTFVVAVIGASATGG
jgi:hypothetical protein